MTKEVAWGKIVGNEFVKRAMEVALAGNHSITIIGNPENGEKYIKTIIPKSIFLSPCPCGNFGDRQNKCFCTPAKIRKYRESKKYKKGIQSDIILEIVRPMAKEYDYAGEDFSKVIERISKRFLGMVYKLETSAKTLLQTATDRFGLTIYQVEQIISVATTISSLDNSTPNILSCHMAEAMQYKFIFN